MSRAFLVFIAILFFALPLFAQSVDTAWVRRYNGPQDANDVAYAMTVDPSGNVYVTGYSWSNSISWNNITIKYYPNGDTAWVRSYQGGEDSTILDCAVVLDDSSNIYVTARSTSSPYNCDFATIKYYPDGDTAWVRRYFGPENGNDMSTAIVINNSSVYVTGCSYTDSIRGSDYATIKYDSDGNELWIKRYNGPENSYDCANAMAGDASGNIFVTGVSSSSGTNYDYLTIKYYQDGDTAWVRRYNGPGNGKDEAYVIAVDSTGNVYVSGRSKGIVTDYDYATIKYDSSGNEIWVKRYDGPEGGYDESADIAIDGIGNVYVTGLSWGDYPPTGTALDYATIKYDTNGNELWVNRYNGPGNESDRAYAISVDSIGNVYVTGASIGSGADYDYASIKYNTNGNELWVRRYSGSGNASDLAYAIAVDDSGDVFVTGRSYDSETSYDCATIKYIQQFLHGDANGDGNVSVSDVVYLISYLFKGGPAPDPMWAGDADCDSSITVTDVVYLINYLFKGGPPPGDPDDNGIPDC